MKIHGWMTLVLHTTFAFLFSELPLLQVVAIVIACLVSAAILGLLCLFLCKYCYDTVENILCSTKSIHVVMLLLYGEYKNEQRIFLTLNVFCLKVEPFVVLYNPFVYSSH